MSTRTQAGQARPRQTGRSLVARLRATACRLGAVLALVLALAARAEDPAVEVKVSRDRLYLGESLVLSVKVQGADRRDAPDLSQIRHCRIKALGSQDISNYSIIIVNGRMQRQGFSGRIFQYELTPDEAGTFATGPVTVHAGGQTLTARGPDVTVAGITRQNRVRISVNASQTAVMVDETFDVTLTVRVRRLGGRYANTEPLFPAKPPVLTVPFLEATPIEGLKGPDVGQLLRSRLANREQPGLAINNYTVRNSPFDFGGFFNMDNPFGERPAVFVLDKRLVEEEGSAYFEYTLGLSYSALAEGTYTFGPVVFKGDVPVEVNDSGQASGTEVFAVGPAVTVRVLPPPEENRPDSYIGAVGSNLTVQAALDAQTCNVGDPVTLTLTLDGPVQMRNVFPPRLSLQTNLLERFEVYDDTVKTLKRESGRQYAYTLRPRAAGSTELPPIDISYYDVRTRSYRTVRSEPIPLKIRQAAEITASQVIGNVTGPVARATGAVSPADLTPAGMDLDPAGARPDVVWGSAPVLVGTLSAGPILFAVTWLLVTLRRHGDARRRARRSRQARARAERTLRRLPLDPAAPAAAHTAICAALREFLSERLALPAAALTPDDAATRLREAGLATDRADEFRLCMDRHFNGAYGSGDRPAPTADEVEAVIRQVEEIDRELPRPAARSPGTKTAVRLLPWLLTGGLLGGVPHAQALAPDEATFLWEDANTSLAAARTAQEFQAAAAQYQKLADAGIRNAPLFYNQGTALLQAGRNDDAIRVLSRAERYAGHRTDVTRNLQIAHARKAGLKTRVALWDRVALFWHYGLAGSTRLLVAAIAFSALWVGLALRLLRRTRTSRFVLAVATALLILFGSSALTTVLQEQAAQRPVFTSSPGP